MHDNALLCVLGACVASLMRPSLAGCSISVLVPVSEAVIAVLANGFIHPFVFFSALTSLYSLPLLPVLSLQKVSLLLHCYSLGAHSRLKRGFN